MRWSSRCCSRCSDRRSQLRRAAPSACATRGRSSPTRPSESTRDPATGRDHGACRRRGAGGRADARSRAPDDGQQSLRPPPGGPLRGLSGAGCRPLRARRRRGRLSARDRGRGHPAARRMTRQARIALFAVSAAGLSALLLWAVAGLPDFGHYRGPYGKVLDSVAVGERHATNVVAAVVFDYRSVDTLGEEFILFASVMGVALLLRHARREKRHVPERMASDAVRLTGIGFAAGLLVLGLYVVAHGYLTPGGGFQGGV